MNKEIINDQENTIHRLQQECTEKTNAIIALGEQLKAKEQECEELKEEIKTKTYHWEQCTEEILKGTKQFVGRMEKAEQTLTEIKEIAYDGYNNGQTSYATFQCEKIIKKINEVEDEKS